MLDAPYGSEPISKWVLNFVLIYSNYLSHSNIPNPF